MKRIEGDITSGQFQNLYLLYGSEDYLKRQYKDKLIKALVNEGDNMNFSKYEGSGISVPQIIDQSETMPFFAERRVILMEDTGFGKKTPEDMGEYLSEIAASTIFIFVETEMDKRSKLYKAAKAVGRDIEIQMPDEKILAAWVRARLKSAGKTMNGGAWGEFLLRTNESMDNMDREMEKLISYVGDRSEVTIDDVRAICIPQVETKIFDMINAIAAKDTYKTLDLYHDMLSAKEPAMRILYMIVRQFRQMKVIKELNHHGDNVGTIARKVGSPDFAVKRNMQLANNFSDDDITNLLEDAATYEQQVKTGRMDENMAVELIMMKYSKK